MLRVDTMSLPAPTSGKLLRRIVASHKLNAASRALARTFFPSRDARFIFVFGCQRSGTTLLKNLIGLDAFVNAAGEYGERWFKQAEYGAPEYLRARDFAELEAGRRAERSRLILVKPLHDSQRIGEFLEAYPDMPMLFAFRNFEGVVRSHLSYFLTGRGTRWGTKGHDPFEYVSGILPSAPPTWKNENHIPEHAAQVERLWEHAETEAEVYAIYWLSRNRLYFDLGIEERVPLIHFEKLLESPSASLDQLSRHIRHRIPRRNALIMTEPETASRRETLAIHPEIRSACEELETRLADSAKCWRERLSA